MRRPVRLVVLAMAAVAVLTACAGPTDGVAVRTAHTDLPGGGPSSTPQTRPDATKPASPVAGIKPCALLLADAATQLGVDAQSGEERKVGSARRCGWRLEGATLNDTFNLDVGIWDNAGIADLPASVDATPVPPVGKHDAVRSRDSAGCSIIMGVGRSSRVDASVNGGSVDKACELAMRLATLVEPRLPEG